MQFRLKQIVDAPQECKEQLLKDLEEFAFRGIPDMRQPHFINGGKWEEIDEQDGISEERHMKCIGSSAVGRGREEVRWEDDLEEKMMVQRARQKELISQLKAQLEDLETYAYVTGEAGPPQSVVLERQRVVIGECLWDSQLNT